MFSYKTQRFCLAWLLFLLAGGTNAYDIGGTYIQDISFTAKLDNTTQKYLLIYPKEFSDHEIYHLLILLHGHGSDRQQALDDSINEFRAGRDLAAARNMLVVAPDYRARTSWMGPAAEADLLQIISELKTRFHIGKTILAGASMGGSSALTFTALHPEMIDGVVSMNGTANLLEYEKFEDAIKKSFGAAKAEHPLEYKKRSAE